MKLTTNPERVCKDELRKVGVILVRNDMLLGGFELVCNQCLERWIPRRPGTVFAQDRVLKLGKKLSPKYWVCWNGCNAHMNQERIFRPVPLGRAVELVETLLSDPQEEQIDAMLELLAGLTDELDCERHPVVASLMRYLSGMRSNAWLDEVQALQRPKVKRSN